MLFEKELLLIDKIIRLGAEDLSKEITTEKAQCVADLNKRGLGNSPGYRTTNFSKIEIEGTKKYGDIVFAAFEKILKLRPEAIQGGEDVSLIKKEIDKAIRTQETVLNSSEGVSNASFHVDQVLKGVMIKFEILILELDKLKPSPTITKGGSSVGTTGIKKEIFVSHSSKDEELVRLFVEQILRLGMDLNTERIFCSSLEGMGIKNGNDFRGAIHDAIDSSKVVIFLITQNYKYSEICQNEMGATWFSGKPVFPFIVEPIKYKTVGVLMEPLQIPKLSTLKDLTDFYDEMKALLKIDNPKSSIWEPARDKFLKELPSVLAKFKDPYTRTPEEVKDLLMKIEQLNSEIKKINGEYQSLKTLYEAVKGTKNKDEVKKLEDEHNSDLWEKFDEILWDVRKALGELPSIVQAIVLCKFFEQDYTVQSGHEDVLEEAGRKKQVFITSDDDYVPNENNVTVKKIHTALEKLQDFIDENKGLAVLYREKYGSDIELNNQTFWEDRFKINIP